MNVEFERRLAGGFNEGAWLVRHHGTRAVLKIHTRSADRVVAAAGRIADAVERGWRTPRWLAVERQADGSVWVLQEYVLGHQPACLDERVASLLVEQMEVQLGLGDGSGGWGEWACGVVFEDWDGHRATARDRFPGGGEVVRMADAIAAACAGTSSPERDLVHGNYDLANTLDDGAGLWLVDAHGAGPGPVEYDAAEIVVLSCAQRATSDAGLERVWNWAVGMLDAALLAVCAASIALTTTDAYDRLRRPDETRTSAPGLVAALDRFAQLVA